MSVYRSKHGFTYHSASSSDLEELAAAVWLRGNNKQTGLRFARKASKLGKYEARQYLLDKYGETWKQPLSIFTMPGMRWPFEKVLLARRFKAGLETEIWSVESNAAIFRAALRLIPGVKRWRNGFTSIVNERTVSTRLISSFEFCEVEDFITREQCPVFDVAWLDFTGFLTDSRVKAISQFWQTRIRHSLTVTSLAARWDKGMSSQIDGDVPGFLSRKLANSRCVNVIEYAEPSPMIQVTLERAA